MQVTSHVDSPLSNAGHVLTTVGINGHHNPAFANTKQFILENVDPSTLDDDDSDSDDGGVLASQIHQQQLHINQTLQNMSPGLSGPKPGKKTKGRVKIKMEFIENKLRRYTTFSKRKTGIMKKAYELSTLTGTQVMLLVASETGHVYTFATRKLQPMITSESGKALIQTCLNSPDAHPFSPGQEQAVEQRMNPSGFEETELTCAVGEEDTKSGLRVLQEGLGKSMFPTQEPQLQSQTSMAPTHQSSPSPTPVTTYIHQQAPSTSSPSQTRSTPTPTQNIAMQLPAGIILQSGTSLIQQASSQQQQQPTVYRLPSNQLVSITSGQLSASGIETTSSSASTTTPSSITMIADGLLSGTTSVSGGTPGIVMYHTPQGVMYATPTLSDRTIFNFQQPAISVGQSDQQVGSAGQQIIIPVPVSIGNNGQLFQLTAAAPAQDGSHPLEILTAPITKKLRKT